MVQPKTHEAEVEAHPNSEVSLTDPDACSMVKADGGSTVSYNVQSTVGSKYHLISTHEVTTAPSCRSQLGSSAKKVIYLAIKEASKKWNMPTRNWKPAVNRFMILFEDRIAEYI